MTLMSRMKPIARHVLLAIIIGLVTYARLQHASAESGVINDNRQRFSIAAPDFPDSSTSDGATGRDIAQGIVSDLKAVGRFVLVDSNITPEANGVVPQFDKWRSTNAEWLVTGSVKESAPRLMEKPSHRLLVEFRLWNVVKGENVLGQMYVVGSEDLQRVPHLIAEEIFKRLTGEDGPSEGAEDRN
jgi:TolB protein